MRILNENLPSVEFNLEKLAGFTLSSIQFRKTYVKMYLRKLQL